MPNNGKLFREYGFSIKEDLLLYA
ncbi:uncharacterized protein FFE2_16086 [Fusarium fujikuroi]|nr:uncharacterized protein FFE2_16086 [Fusarium fujikuroi]